MIVGHIDADCFYVSAERVRSPHLRRTPVGVVSNQGAFVIAKSYEMKARGVSTGMPIWDALKICPEAIYVKRDYRWYEALSRRMLAVLREASPTVEYYSIDEFFFAADVLDRPLLEAARALQQRILIHCGIPCSIGISLSKTLAKFASDANKPFGALVALQPIEIEALLRGQPVEEITGIAQRSAAKLAKHGITTCGQFVAAQRPFIRKLLTKKGEELWWELRGEAVIPIVTQRPMHKHVARGGSVGKATADGDRLLGYVVRNVERLIEALDAFGYVCHALVLELSHKDGGFWRDRCSLPLATAHCEILIPAAADLFRAGWIPGRVVSYMHVVACHLEMRGQRQLSLFGPSHFKLDRIKRLVNEKCGRFAIRSGATLALGDVYEDEANSYDICDIHGKSCF